MSPASLLNLPPELLLLIGDYLPQDGILALKFSHSALYNTLPLAPRFRNTTLSDCARLAIRTYLAPPDPKPSHMRCILCKSIYPTSLFQRSNRPIVPISFEQGTRPTEAVELPQRVCSWHRGRLSRVIHTGRGGPNEWLTRKENMCMHCGAIQAWQPCHCNCDSCGLREVKTHTYLDNIKGGNGPSSGRNRYQ